MSYCKNNNNNNGNALSCCSVWSLIFDNICQYHKTRNYLVIKNI